PIERLPEYKVGQAERLGERAVVIVKGRRKLPLRDIPVFFAGGDQTIVQADAERVLSIDGLPPTDHRESLPGPAQAKDFHARPVAAAMIGRDMGFEQR